MLKQHVLRLQTQELLPNSGVHFSSSSECSASSRDFNVCENIGRILKGRVKELMASYGGIQSFNELWSSVVKGLKEIKFWSLGGGGICWNQTPQEFLQAVKQADGDYTKY